MPRPARRPPAAAAVAATVVQTRAQPHAGTVLVVLGAVLLEGVLESLIGKRALWGSHTLAFVPRGWWLVVPLAGLALVPPVLARLTAAVTRVLAGLARHPALPWTVGVLAAIVFWLCREQHLFWGDALPLSINVPKGQAFHPDEPLTLWIQHALYAAGGGRWRAETAIAVGSAAAGGVCAGLACAWLRRRQGDRSLGVLATCALLAQGFAALFFGHVENYAYVTVAIVGFLTSGIDFLERRGPLWVPAAWLLLAYALHLLGALLVPPAIYLAVVGLRRPEARRPTLLTLAGTAALALGVAVGVRGLYGGEWPWMQLWNGVLKVLEQPHDMTAGAFFSARHAGDAWSHMVQMGPLSLAAVATIAALLPSRDFFAGDTGRFAAIAAIACYGPALLTGQGNLGAARNWDLFAGPSVAVALLGILLIVDTAGARASALLVALVAVSLAQRIPWVVMNVRPAFAAARVAALPLGNGRPQMMLGTAALNAGRLTEAETHFRAALGEDSLNASALSGLGLALARSGRFEEAEIPLRRVADLKA